MLGIYAVDLGFPPHGLHSTNEAQTDLSGREKNLADQRMETNSMDFHEFCLQNPESSVRSCRVFDRFMMF